MHIFENCKVEECYKGIHCKGFCRSHYNKYYKGKLDFEGNPVNGYIDKFQKGNKCKYPDCHTVGTAKSSLRNGLCNKHRKWADKGWIDRDSCKILQPEKIPYQKEFTGCKVLHCYNKHKAKGFCSNHYRSYQTYKTIDINGNHIGNKKKYSSNHKCTIMDCFKKGPYVKGFCKYHYEHYRKGIYNEDGVKIGKLKKVYKYSPFATCKIPSCTRKPRQRGFCECCASRIKNGTLTEKGFSTSKTLHKNKGKVCSEINCSKEAYSKGLCKLHYSRSISDYQGPEFYKNVGQTCSEDRCNQPAYCRTLCSKHYRIHLRIEKGEKIREIVNKDRMCRNKGCGNPAVTRRFCDSHYQYHLRNKNKKILEDLDIRPPMVLKNNITVDTTRCLSVGCTDKPVKDKLGLCSKHYVEYKLYHPEYTDILLEKNKNNNEFCKVLGCNHKPHSHGICQRHYDYFKSNDTPEKYWKNSKDNLEMVFKSIKYSNKNKCRAIACSKEKEEGKDFCYEHLNYYQVNYRVEILDA